MNNSHLKIICPSCHSENLAEKICCLSCQYLLDRTDLNDFVFMNLKPSFELDFDALEKQYLVLQKQLHPDNFATADMSLQLLAMHQGSHLNDCYNKLKSDVNRAVYLFEIYKLKNPLKTLSKDNQQLLQEQFELRERLAEGEEKIILKQEVGTKITVVKNAISNLFYDPQKNEKMLAENIIKLQFLSKFMQELCS